MIFFPEKLTFVYPFMVLIYYLSKAFDITIAKLNFQIDIVVGVNINYKIICFIPREPTFIRDKKSLL